MVEFDGFWIAKTETTWGSWSKCERAGACPELERPSFKHTLSHPVNEVSWFDAQKFCAWAGGRLPTAAEWEYTAKSGGRAQRYPWGNNGAYMDFGNYYHSKEGGDDIWSRGDGYPDTAPVGAFPKGDSLYQVSDLVSNVGEWTSSEDETGKQREVRGGTFGNAAHDRTQRSSARLFYKPDATWRDTGFRCAK